MPPDDAVEHEEARMRGFSGRTPVPVPLGSDDDIMIPEDFSSVREMMSPGKTSGELDVRSDINDLQMIQMARARFIADDWGVPALHAFVDNLLRLSVSKQRKGRKEVVEMHRSALYGQTEAASGAWGSLMNRMKE